MTFTFVYGIIGKPKSKSGEGENMRDVYIFEYLNEAEFKKMERSVKKYNMFAYKKLIFDFYPEMKNGNFIGNKVSENKEKNTVSYELTLTTDELFVKVHGEIVLHYDVYTNKNIILLKTITPEDLLIEGHNTHICVSNLHNNI